MPTYVFFLGRQAELSTKELEGVCRTHKLPTPIVKGELAWLDLSEKLPDNFLDQLGGTDRIAEMVSEFSSFPTAEQVIEALSPLPSKWMLGVSTIGSTTSGNLKRFGMDMKKLARAENSRLKFVMPNGKQPRLNAAQVIFNKLHVTPNAELIFLSDSGHIKLLRTVQIQNIMAYEKRDTGKPARDARSGMLPPKLAQIMLNIATSQLPPELSESPITILDPFCGGGVVVQEGWLKGYKMHGSDSSVKAVESTHKNLEWLAEEFRPDSTLAPEIIARDVKNTFPGAWKNSFAAIVTEPYLGPPVKIPLSPSLAEERVKELAAIYRPAFKTFHSLLKPGGVVVFLFPVFYTQNGWVAFPNNIIDGLTQIGYRLVQLSSTPRSLIYKRPDALVGREISVWQKQ